MGRGAQIGAGLAASAETCMEYWHDRSIMYRDALPYPWVGNVQSCSQRVAVSDISERRLSFYAALVPHVVADPIKGCLGTRPTQASALGASIMILCRGASLLTTVPFPLSDYHTSVSMYVLRTVAQSSALAGMQSDGRHRL
jgi:hypothetical protein